MTTTRIMFVGQGASLLPEDRFVNVFHFHDPTLLPWDDSLIPLLDCVENFYTQATTGGNSISTYLSLYMSRAAKLIAYNLSEPPPRVPHEVGITLGAALGGGYAEEAAIVLTLTGAPPITARRRGRLYIGPLSNSGSCVVAASTSSPTRVAMSAANEVGHTILAAADRLLDQAALTGVPWCIRSTVPSENFVPITARWLDNALDTQRRRGPDPTTRATFGI